MMDNSLALLLGYPGNDPGCDAALDEIDRYCDAVRRGADAAREFPGVALHLRNCAACLEDTEGILAALAREDIETTQEGT